MLRRPTVADRLAAGTAPWSNPVFESRLNASPSSPLERLLGWFLVVVMAVSVLNVLWQVFTRFVLSNPSSYTEELARYLLIWIGLIGAAYASGRQLHLAIDLLPRALHGRSRLALQVTIRLIVAAFAVAVLGYGGFVLVRISLGLGQTSAALGVPIGLVYSVIPVSGLLITWFAVRDIIGLLHGREPT